MRRLGALRCPAHTDGWPLVKGGVILTILSLLGAVAAAAPEQEAESVLSAGARVLGQDLETVFAVGQPGGVSVSHAGTYVHYAGLLGCCAIRPTIDINTNGVADEWDPDNDSDGLADYDEVTGAAFGGYATTDLNAADTDSDGMSDGDEAAAMFDPRDSLHCLRFLSIARSGEGDDGLTLRWVGRGGGTVNSVWMSDGSEIMAVTNHLSSLSYYGGYFPWYKVTNTYADVSGAAETRFYRLRVLTP